MVCESDLKRSRKTIPGVLRGGGDAYAGKLTDAGVRVTSTCYHGIMHDFVILNALAGTFAVRAALARAVWAPKNALERPCVDCRRAG
jgi:acetyl esterase